jgi:hypothetical protein
VEFVVLQLLPVPQHAQHCLRFSLAGLCQLT